jgi:hypothetical protein
VRIPLKLHPESRCEAVTAIEVEVGRTGERLSLRYVLSGDLAEIVLPAAAASPERADELWRRTCFEAFVRPAGSEGYVELNFAPSTQWAAYRFDRYREGMRAAEAAPAIEVVRGPDRLALTAAVELAAPGDWDFGLSAVIEEAGGRISYWAAAHPPGRADFHHADCFALRLPATGTA